MKNDIAANIAFFLLETTGSIFSKVQLVMSKKDQNKLFNWYFGDTMLTIDGSNETIKHTHDFGNTTVITVTKWSEL